MCSGMTSLCRLTSVVSVNLNLKESSVVRRGAGTGAVASVRGCVDSGAG